MTSDDNIRAPRRTRAFWQAHTDQWKQSGLSKIAYSREHNLKPISFYNWSKKLDNAEPLLVTPADTATSFLPVQINGEDTKRHDSTQCVHINRAGVDVALPIDLSVQQIQHWLQAICTLHV